MSIRSLTLENFKGFSSPTTVQLRPITLLFGGNSAGKSSILQALLYAREILERRNADPDQTLLGGDAVDLGGFRNLVHNHDTSLDISLRFDLDLSQVKLSSFYKPDAYFDTHDWAPIDVTKPAWVQIVVSSGRALDEPAQANYEIGFNGLPALSLIALPTQVGRYVVHYNVLNPFVSRFHPETESTAKSPVIFSLRKPYWNYVTEVEWPDYQPTSEGKWKPLAVVDVSSWERPRREYWAEGKVSDSPRSNRRYETLFEEIFSLIAEDAETTDAIPDIGPSINGLVNYLLNNLRALRYIGPIRAIPNRNSEPSRSPEGVGWADGMAAWDWIHKASAEQTKELNKWLGPDHLNIGYRVEVKRYKEIDTESLAWESLLQGPGRSKRDKKLAADISALPVKTRIQLRQIKDSLEVTPRDVGIGISQVIPVVVATLMDDEGITVMEQPELHMHPAVQVALGDLFIQRTAEAFGKGRMFIIETHSEHLLLRILRRVRETALKQAPAGLELLPDGVAVCYIEAREGGAEIQHLRIDEDGRFMDRWPHGFFPERMRENLPKEIRERVKAKERGSE